MQARIWLVCAAVVWTTIQVSPSFAANQADDPVVHFGKTQQNVSTGQIGTPPLSLPTRSQPPATVENSPRPSARGAVDLLRPSSNSGLSVPFALPAPGLMWLLTAEPEILPANLVRVRISRRFLERHLARSVERESDVVDHILGTDIRGRAVTSGSTRLVLERAAHA